MSTETITYIRKEGERLFSALETELFTNLSGLSKKSGIQEIFNSYREFGESELFDSINEKAIKKDEKDCALNLLRAFLARTYTLSRSASHTDKLLSLEASLAIKIGKRKIPFRSALQKILNEPKKKKRDDILTHGSLALKELIPLLREIHYTISSASENLGFSNYKELTERACGIDIEKQTNVARAFIRDTEYVSREMLEWFFMKLMEIPLKDATSADLAFMLNSFDLEGGFSEKDYKVPAAMTLDDSGLVNRASVTADTEKRGSKAPGGLLFLTSPPQGMEVSIYPARGPYDYESYLSALGRALCYAFTQRDEHFEDKFLRDPSQTGTFSELFQNLMYERKWLDRYIDYERGSDFYKLLYLRRLMQVRSIAARTIYEELLYSGESAEDLTDSYKEITGKALHTQVDENNYLRIVDIREQVSSPGRFRGCLIEPCLSKYLSESYDEEWWRVREAGEYLKNIWKEGAKYDSNDLASTTGFDGSASLLLKVFERELS